MTGSWVLSPPETVCQIDQRDVEKRKNAKDCGDPRTSFRLVDYCAEQKVRDIQQPQNKGGGEFRVPRPPNAPDGLSPQRPRYESNRAACHTNFNACDAEPIPFR